MTDAALVSLEGITRRFPGVTALDRLDLALMPGEVHVVLGENGAGKSTLVAILSGLQQPDAGVVRVAGRPVRLASPRRALALGIGTVFQHSMLVPSLTVAENVALGGRWWAPPDRAGLRRRIGALAAELGIAVDPDAVAGTLSLGERQQAEILRALMRGGRVVILDEATAMLTPRGAAELGALMRRLVAQGFAVLFITHKLAEAQAWGDRITVLCRGRKTGEIAPARLATLDRAAVGREALRLLFGEAAAEEAAQTPRRIAPAAAPPVLEIEALAAGDPAMPLADITFAIAGGEILGVAGIDGNGQRQLAEARAGQRPATAGRIRLDGRPLDALSVDDRRALGLRYVTDDRLGEGIVTTMAVSDNLVLKDIGRPPFWRRGVERRAEIDRHARALVAAFDVRTPAIDTPAGRLSGGNIQKVILARELDGVARAVIFAKPTNGLDVVNARAVRRRIREAAARGTAVLLFSTDLDELLDLSDRIAVMSRGRLVATVANDGSARARLGDLVSGIAA